ncbi:unnamed protein product [Owenia fusiformis]|uniref:Tetraspanin n=1 Tax=Owenia fusiformis TaxID=6347 RepID=A0A8J1XGY8_OWEFU|nr:unnamed protein product [Owenia fusiformis]
MACCEKYEDSYVSPVVKYLLFTFNFIFWLCGVGLIAVGTWAFIEKNSFTYDSVKSIYDVLFDVSVIFIVVGCFIFILAFAGCLGALRENICLLYFFAIAIAVIFILEVIGVVLCFVFAQQAKAAITDLLQDEVIVRYRDDPDLQNLIDWVQKTFECCGVGEKGYKDWSLNIYFNCTEGNPSPEKCGVPYSCCSIENDIDDNYINTMCGYGMQDLSPSTASKKIYINGCVDGVLLFAERNLYIAGGIALGIAIPQLLGIFLSRILIGQIKDQRDRWV